MTETFHVIEKGGKYWGVQYADGRSTEEGWGDILKARRVDPKYCHKPEDVTWRGSHYVRSLREGRIVKVRLTVTAEIIG